MFPQEQILCQLQPTTFSIISQFLHPIVVLYIHCGIFVALIDTSFVHDQKLLSKDIVMIDSYSWIGLWGTAIIAVVAVFAGYKSVQFIGPVSQSFIRTSGLIGPYVLQIAFFHDPWNVLELVGAGCIIFSVLAIVLEDKVMAKIPDGIIKKIV